jgi:hypothetical protein
MNNFLEDISANAIGGLITAFILAGAAWIFGFFPIIWEVLKSLYRLLLIPISIPLVLLVFFILLFGYNLIRLSLSLFPDEQKFPYTEDILFGIHWEWNINQNGDEIYPVRPVGFCPHCKSRLISDVSREFSYKHSDFLYSTDFYCEYCDKVLWTSDGNYMYAIGRVRREIERIINSGEWKRKITKD